jgi:hypothetical protein
MSALRATGIAGSLTAVRTAVRITVLAASTVAALGTVVVVLVVVVVPTLVSAEYGREN